MIWRDVWIIWGWNVKTWNLEMSTRVKSAKSSCKEDKYDDQ